MLPGHFGFTLCTYFTLGPLKNNIYRKAIGNSKYEFKDSVVA